MIPPSVGLDPHIHALALLDLAKVATTVLFVTSAVDNSGNNPRTEILDEWGQNIMQTLISQGLPTPIVAITNIDKIPVKV